MDERPFTCPFDYLNRRQAHMTSRVFAFVFAVAAILDAETRSVSRLPMSFERNVGQAAADVRYLGRDGEGTVLLKAGEVVFLGSHGSAGMRFRGASAQARID